MPRTVLADAEAEADRADARRGRRFIAALVFLAICAMSFVGWRAGTVVSHTDKLDRDVHELRKVQDAGIVRGYKLRAVGCRTIELAGGTFSKGDPCLDPEMTPYFHPSASSVVP